MGKNLREAIVKLDETEAIEIVKEKINNGEDLLAVIKEAREGMEIVGRHFETGEYFLSELIMAGEIFKDMMQIIEPRLSEGAEKKIGKIVIATVKGDEHDLGKNIVTNLLKAAGFEIYDLGTNIHPDRIIQKLRETKAPVLGLSCLLTTSLPFMKETVERVNDSDLKGKVKIIIGGGITQGALSFVGADAQTCNASEGVSIIKNWILSPGA